jgi:6-phosphogluconolactonase
MPAVDGPDGDDVDAAARRYCEELASFAEGRSGPSGVPAFDVVLLGVGPDGHVASLFPGSAPLAERSRSVVAVRDSPKPPPTRLSLTVPALCRAEEIWLLAAGTEKSRAVSEALSVGSGLPATTVHGRERTLWLLDAAAAEQVPSREGRPAAPPS